MVKSALSGSILTRSSSRTRGVSAVSTVSSTFFSCSTLLCLRLCIRATGAVFTSEVRKIAVPGTRCCWRARSISIRSAIGTESRRTFSDRIWFPWVQVHISITRPAPSISGSHAPSGIFSRFEDMNTTSRIPSGTRSAAAASQLHFQIRRTTTTASRVSTNIAPVTAIP